MKDSFKKDCRAKKAVLAELFKDLRKFVKKGESGDVPLAESVGQLAGMQKV